MLLRLFLAALFVPVAWGIHASHLDLREQLKIKSNANQEAMMLPPEFLQLMSFGHDSLMADVLWLQMIQYYGAAHEQDLSPQYLYNYFDTITTLDPDFEAGYVFSSYLLADDKAQLADAVKLLAKGEQNLPNNWVIPFQAGFLNYIQLKNNLKAAQDFERAASKPGAPELASRMAAQLYKKTNDADRCQLSLRLWKNALEQAPNPDLKGRAERHVVETQIYCDLLMLRKALTSYGTASQQSWQKAVAEAKAKRLPPPKAPPVQAPASLQELVTAGLLSQVPLDPLGRPYLYRAQTGTVIAQALPWKPIDLFKTDVAGGKSTP